MQGVADWRQIQARIRKAKAGEDPLGGLGQLYEKTRDAMVALELGRLYEQSGQNDEAVRWYTVAVERFRRAQWRAKAVEALARLGAPIPAPAEAPGASLPEPVPGTEPERESAETSAEQAPLEPAAPETSGAGSAPERRRRRRRGRRGGRKRRRGGRAEAPAARIEPARPAREVSTSRPLAAEETAEVPSEPARAHEPAVAPAAWQVRGRAGEPALASRLAHLESQLRRLIAGPLYRLDEPEQAPAGPGVFILSDSDQTTHYYIEASRTLRVGVGNLVRGERGARPGESLRARFAKHLGITDSRVSKYLKEHCVVRWLQLDEDAAMLAHFAIAVLRPVLNE